MLNNMQKEEREEQEDIVIGMDVDGLAPWQKLVLSLPNNLDLH